MRAIRLLPLMTALVLVACTTGASPIPSASPSGEPSGAPTADFAIEVIPPEEPAAVRAARPGQHVAFLVRLIDEAEGPGVVTITATAEKAAVDRIEPVQLSAGTVGEVWVVPDPAADETTALVTITATRDGTTKSVTRSLPILPMEGDREADAQPYFELWRDWLVAEHPELGITADTAWQPEFVSTLLVVSHYAYWSEDWEVTVAWHNMIPPDDWTEIHLRHRWTESKPCLAFRIDSVAGETEPHPVTPPEVVVR